MGTRTARTFGKLVAVPVLLVWGGGAMACRAGHADCASIAPGASAATLPPLGEPSGPTPYCQPLSGPTGAEELALRCCSNPFAPSDGGVKDCSAQGYGPLVVDCGLIPPTEFRAVGEPYSGWECAPDEGWGAPHYGCYVWVRDGGVIGACGGCPPD